MYLEICASSHQSALNAQRAGAHRIELCTELGLGGITPSYGLLRRVIAHLSIPVNVLIRPRSGDFTYSDEELEIMKEDIKVCKELGAAGIVTGVLNSDLTIAVEKTKELLALTRPLSFTFHRAFDWTTDPFVAMEILAEIGVDQILSSGQESSAYLGISLLEALQKQARNRLEILPGGGINLKNIDRFKELGFTAVHTSASEILTGSGVGPLPMNTPRMLEDGIRIESDFEKIQELLKAIENRSST